MPLTTMYAHTAITATARYIGKGRQHKERREYAMDWACLITQNLPSPIDSKWQSIRFLATNVTKKLDHYNIQIISQTSFPF